jgi:cell fate (sporulation/competence/biofilm development) regulator YlbF (YheA/YmcA/DUF963 family)
MPVETTLLEARPRVLTSQTTRVSTTLGTAFVTLTRDSEGQPLEIFLNVGKAGSDTYATAEALGRLISLALHLESPASRAERAHELADQLQNIGVRMDVAEQPSIPDALARVLREALTESAPAVPDSPLPTEPVHPESMAKAVQVLANISNPTKKRNKGKNLMDTTAITLPENISTAVDRLAAAVLRAQPIADYQQAKAHLDTDPEARGLLERLAKAQSDLRTRQAQNAVTQTDIDQLRVIQRQVQSNRKIMDYAKTQQAAVAYLPAVNQEISLLLGVDFAALAGPGSC